MSLVQRLKPLFHVALPVAVAASLIALAAINMVLVKTWKGEPEDGVLWRQEGANVVAADVAPRSAGRHAGILPGDVLLSINGREVAELGDVQATLHRADDGRVLRYVVHRPTVETPLDVRLQPMPLVATGLYYSVALVGILAIVIGASVRLRRPNDPATLHFFWLTVSFFGVLAFTPSGRYDRLDYFFEWADMVARLALPPMFLHFAFVFPERSDPWVRTAAGRMVLPLFYLPAFVIGIVRALVMARAIDIGPISVWLSRFETLSHLYLGACLLAGLGVMLRALTRLRSVTSRRQLRWIVWGSSLGALPFISLYLIPFLLDRPVAGAEYTAVLLGCIPLAFASAIVRYRLMDIEVIIKRALVVSAVGLLLAGIYVGTLFLVDFLPGTDENRNSFWAMFATLIVAVAAPGLWRAIQSGLDRLYYRDRYDYRRALLSFTRDLNSDLDLNRLSQRLVDRIAETLAVDHIALLLPDPRSDTGRFTVCASAGQPAEANVTIEPGTALAARLKDGQTVVVDDPISVRRLGGSEGANWRDAGYTSFVPCVSNDLTIAVLAVGRRPHGEPLSSEDMSLLSAVAGQAATAIENARLYSQLQEKANEIEAVRQFNANVVESLSDALVVVDRDDRVLLWNRGAASLSGHPRAAAVGRRTTELFPSAFFQAFDAARRESPSGTSLFRVQYGPVPGGEGERLVNLAIAPFQRGERDQAGWILVLADVTDRANLEEQLRLSEKMAAIGLLAAGVAHEVNTPLTGISSFTQMLLERSAEGDAGRELLEKIERQTFRAAKIVNNLLNLSRPTTGETGVFELNQTIGDMLSLLEHQLRTSHIQVRRDLSSAPLLVRGFEYKLQQVFLNLFLNARDAMPKGGWLTVTSRADDDEAVVEVADTGAGIAPEHLARIYDPFFTTKGEGRGTGLGLSVTYGIVQEHGGTLACESEPGQGTRFRLALPLVIEAEETAAAAAIRQEQG
jgi:PAS domain S-box-containing protein